MNDERVRIYVDDQLALVIGEIELAERCHGNNRAGALGEFLARWTGDLKQQRAVMEDVLHRIGTSGNILKQGMAWLAEKAGRFKLNDSLFRYSDLSRLVELETLAVGACKRVAFWENLHEFCRRDSRLADINFVGLRDATQKQLDGIHEFRIDAARHAFAKSCPIT